MPDKTSDIRGLFSEFQNTLADVENLLDTSESAMFNSDDLRMLRNLRSDLSEESAKLDKEFAQHLKDLESEEEKAGTEKS